MPAFYSELVAFQRTPIDHGQKINTKLFYCKLTQTSIFQWEIETKIEPCEIDGLSSTSFRRE